VRGYKTEGIILQNRNYSEADNIVTIFTKTQGKVVVIAKGVRKPKSRKRGSLELFNHVKLSVSQTRGMGIITEAEIVASHKKVRSSLNKASLAYYFSEVITALTREEEKNERLFAYTLKLFKFLESAKELKKLRKAFVKDILVILGFWPASKPLLDPDQVLEEVIEKKLKTPSIGKKLLA